MNSYAIYGLTLASIIEFPELSPSGGTAQITLELGDLNFAAPDTSSVIYRPVSPSEIFVFYRGVGTALVTAGSRIVVQPAAGVDPLILRLFLLQQTLGVALLQRGYFVLHASASVVKGRAIAFAGPSGEGKSTIAAALNARNYPVLTDDVLAMETRVQPPLAFPGLLQLKLSEEARLEVAPQIKSEQTLGDRRAKKLCCVRGAAVLEPVPLDSIYLLATGPELTFRSVSPARAAIELVRHTYGSRLLQAIGLSGAHFEQCIALARQVPVRILTRPRDLALLPRIADGIEERLQRPIGA